jgi:hypothetical protein
MERNDQTYGRRRAYTDHPKIKLRIDEVFGESFNPSRFP